MGFDGYAIGGLSVGEPNDTMYKVVAHTAPLLPDDESALAQRAEALALWCHGFLAGLVVGGVDLAGDPSGLSAELNELVRDFAEISRAGAEAEEAGESGDRSLTELIEYVRVGAQCIFEELVAGSDGRDSPTIH